jgi:hypothetical protein
MADPSMWGPGPLSEEEAIKLSMAVQAWRYCLFGLGLALLWVAFVHFVDTSFWSDWLAREMERRQLWR